MIKVNSSDAGIASHIPGTPKIRGRHKNIATTKITPLKRVKIVARYAFSRL